MAPKLRIISRLIERLEKVKNLGQIGGLYGVQNQDTVYLVGFHLRPDLSEIKPEENEDLNNVVEYDFGDLNYPTEIDLYGIVWFCETNAEPGKEDKIKQHANDVFVTDNPVYIKVIPLQPLKTLVLLNDSFEEIPYIEISLDEFHDVFTYVRLIGSIPLVCDTDAEAITQHFDNLRKKVSKGDSIIYKASTQKSKDHFIFAQTNHNNKSLTVNDLIQAQVGRKPTGKDHMLPLTIQFLLRISKDKLDKEPMNPAPSMTIHRGNVRAFDTRLNIDSLAVIPRGKKCSDIYIQLAACLSTRIKHLKKLLVKDSRSTLVSHHFFPPSMDHFITLLYFNRTSDAELVSYRELIHKRLCLSMDKPQFRRGNAHTFNTTLISPTSSHTILRDVHIGLNKSGVNGSLSLVRGHYQYYHYRQQGENDDGWGCAYRSLQTLYSWFLLEGFTSKPVPSIREIQETLVYIQDKPPKFLGSKDWIGSTEVSFVLDTLLGVTCRILSVQANETLDCRVPELCSHFETHGTPVMIGGGVLAHTILGVEYDKEQDAAKFLVLDPHYSGEENLQVIQSKGWCGWKTANFWKKGTFYNMCLPMKKSCV
uniref:Probable Ufm1-specific protease 2 n=1 Tax=Cacopsylla melanoneura TaxID=428564 RepID=A0A8D8PLJ0_9HEMI